MVKIYLVIVLVVKYIMLDLVAGSHHVLRAVVVGLFVLKIFNTINSDQVVITLVCGVHSNTCDLYHVDQFLLTRTRSGDYKNVQISLLRKLWFRWLYNISY